MRLFAQLSLASAGLLLAGTPAFAANPTTERNAYLGGIVSAAGQVASKPEGHNEGTVNILIEGTKEMGAGVWRMDLVGNSSPRHNGVDQAFGSNALVGTTTDEHGDGRLVAKQFYYSADSRAGRFNIGLLNPEDWVGTTKNSQNRYTQFMANAFVHNPAIDMPESVLGISYQGYWSDHAGFMLWVSSDSGLEEEDHSYNNVFSLTGSHKNGHKKGVLTNAEVSWVDDNAWIKGGVWYDTGRIDHVDNSKGSSNRYGFYALLGEKFGPGTMEIQAGFANDHATEAKSFQALSFSVPIGMDNEPDSTLGMAIARTQNSKYLGNNSSSIFQAEVYWRFNVAENFYVTPDFQYIRHAQFKSNKSPVYIGGVRAGLEF